MKKLIAFFLLISAAFATTTVTGKINNLGTGGIGASGAFVRFWLRGCAGNQPRINSVAVIGPSQGGVFFFDFPANSSGNVSGSLYATRDATGNLGGQIECGGSTTGVWYGMQIYVSGKGGPEVAVHAQDTQTLDISTVTPLSTTPTSTAPSPSNFNGILNFIQSPTSDWNINLGTHRQFLTAGDYGASPVDGIWNETDTSSSPTDTSFEHTITIPIGGYHSPLHLIIGANDAFKVCNTNGATHTGIVVMGSGISCPALTTNPVSKAWAFAATSTHPALTVYDFAVGYTTNLLQLFARTVSSPNYNFFATCASASNVDGTCTNLITTLRGDGLFTTPSINFTTKLSGGLTPPTACDSTGQGCIALNTSTGAVTPTSGQNTFRFVSGQMQCSINGGAEGPCVTAAQGNAPSNNSATVTGYGYDVRGSGFGALLNSNGTTGNGNDDAPAIAACLTAFHECYIPAVVNGGVTHVRLATPQVLLGSGNATFKLTCMGNFSNGTSNGAGQGSVELDIDNGNSVNGAGPAFWVGNPANAPFNGPHFSNCHAVDISTSHNSPGFIGSINVSNMAFDNMGADQIRNPNLVGTVLPAVAITCSTTGGNISTTAFPMTVAASAISQGFSTAPVSPTVTVTALQAGASGTTNSCTPAQPTTIDSRAVGLEYFLNGHQVGMPFVSAAGTVDFGHNFNYGQAATVATAITCIPGTNVGVCTTATGNSSDNFDHTWGYGLYLQGTAGFNCGVHGDTCASNQFANQPHINRWDCENTAMCLDFDNKVAAALVADSHANLFTGGIGCIQTESGIGVSNYHCEGGGTGTAIGAANGTITAAANVLTSASNPFTLNMVGRVLSLSNAGVGGGVLTTYITAFTNTGSVTLADNAVTSSTTAVITILQGPQLRVTGNTSSIFTNTFLESGNPIIGVLGFGMVKSQFFISCGNAFAKCIESDPTSSNNQLWLNDFAGTSQWQYGSDQVNLTSVGSRDVVALATQTASSTTPVAITGASWKFQPGMVGDISCHGSYQGANGSAGLTFTVTGPASPAAVSYDERITTALTANVPTDFVQSVTGTSYPAPTLGAAVSAGSTIYPFEFHLQMTNGPTVGTVVVKFASIAAANVILSKGVRCTISY